MNRWAWSCQGPGGGARQSGRGIRTEHTASATHRRPRACPLKTRTRRAAASGRAYQRARETTGAGHVPHWRRLRRRSQRSTTLPRLPQGKARQQRRRRRRRTPTPAEHAPSTPAPRRTFCRGSTYSFPGARSGGALAAAAGPASGPGPGPAPPPCALPLPLLAAFSFLPLLAMVLGAAAV